MNRVKLLALSLLVLFTACGDKHYVAFVPQGAKAGWTEGNVREILACHASDKKYAEAFCKCTITATTTMFTPEEVQSPTPETMQVLRSIKDGCEVVADQAVKGNSIEGSVKPNPTPVMPNPEGTPGNTMAYQFEENGCSTGVQKFHSLEQMCLGLQSDSLNKGCALSLRKGHFTENCPGVFNPLP